MSIKRWKIQAQNAALSERLERETNLSNLPIGVLVSRGITTAEDISTFLSDAILYEPVLLLQDMAPAVARIKTALAQQETIAIYGDYDCDGITSTAMLMDYFSGQAASVFYYIPDRESEGYGLNNSALDKIHACGAALIITVDNGITAHEEIDYANSLGMDVIVTDHHTPRGTMPDALAVINPHRPDCPSQFKEFAGVGVAYQLVCALEGVEIPGLLERYSDLVTIGTIADIVPLVRENRGIVKYGLAHLPQSPRVGIQALLELAGVTGAAGPLNSDSVAFGLAPRLNAAGRMGQVEDAVELLLSKDLATAKALASKLQEYNLQRRAIEEDILLEIDTIIAANPELTQQRILLLQGENWHPGVLGIVASRLLEQYGKPSLVLSSKNGVSSGSGRSIEGFDLIEAITACSQGLLHYGGHTMAAGATLNTEDIPLFSAALQDYAARHYEVMPVPSLGVAMVLDGSQLQIKNVQQLEILGPFGAHNETPLFGLEQVTIKGLYPTRDGNHLRLLLEAQGNQFTAIYFRMPAGEFPYRVGDSIDLVVGLEVSVWNNAPQLSVRVEDLRGANLPQDEIIAQRDDYQRYCRKEYGQSVKERLLPTREQFALVFRYLRSENGFSYKPIALYERLLTRDISYGQLRIILDTLEELGLIDTQQGNIVLCPTQAKVNLEDSAIIQELQNI